MLQEGATEEKGENARLVSPLKCSFSVKGLYIYNIRPCGRVFLPVFTHSVKSLF